jgi:hypothetical protein
VLILKSASNDSILVLELHLERAVLGKRAVFLSNNGFLALLEIKYEDYFLKVFLEGIKG